ncbi:hypothetical protein [Streptomyces catenulae]|uniref:ATP-binding protein n=1 Tax=Streptomyces catenulae TaxID=66875 RepID=A0ABV2Z6Q5_9ACTN|nr:hypothetical protein [Streptomyces catenulae]
MSEGDSATWIRESLGPVQAAPGDQHNHFYAPLGGGPAQAGEAPKDPLTVAREHRAWLSRRFAPPAGFGGAVDRLAKPGSTVLLDGPEGVGLRTAATVLLHRLGTPDSPFEELPAGQEGDEDVPDIARGDRFLLDLSATSDDSYRDAQQRLVVRQEKVWERGAWMAVVLPTGLRHQLRPDLASLTVELGRPDGVRALALHLRRNGIDVERRSLETPKLKHLVHESSMREIFDFADLVRRARERAGRKGSFPGWCAEALAAVTRRPEEVTEQVQKLQHVPERALLLSAAMLSDVPADAVHQGAAELLRGLGHEDEGTPLLARPGLGERLDALGVRREEDGRVRFAKLAYDGAVRLHFWVNYPDLRQELRNWVVKVARFPGLTGRDRERLAARFAEQCLVVDRPHDLWSVVEEWTVSDGMEAEAAALLEQGLGHSRHAARIRYRIYQWVTGPHLSVALARVVTRVCRQTLAATHPDQALVRLHHLALRPGEEADVAWDDLLGLVRGSRRLHARLVERLLTVRRGDEKRKFRLLRDLIDPARLGFCPYRTSLRDAWRAVLARSDSPAVWKPLAFALFTAVHERRDWHRAPDALIRAADGDPGVLNHLYVMTCDWTAAAPTPRDRAARQTIAAGIRQKIDAAQGLDFTTDRPGASQGEPR